MSDGKGESRFFEHFCEAPRGDSRSNASCESRGVDRDGVEVRAVDKDSGVTDGSTAEIVAATSDRDAKAVLAGESDRRSDRLFRGHRRDHVGKSIRLAPIPQPRLPNSLVVVVAAPYNPAVDSPA
jgi:hypothetical protein